MYGKRFIIGFARISGYILISERVAVWFMDSTQAKLLFPAGAVLEFLGALTLVTDDGALISGVDLGFSIPAILPVEVQGIGLLAAGGLLTAFGIKQMSQ